MEIKELMVKDTKNIMMDKALIIVLVFMITGIITIEPSLPQIRVLINILTQSVVKIICVLGLTFALPSGGTDLSGGRQAGPATVIVVSPSQIADYSNKFWPGPPELPITISVIMTLTLVAVTGVVNGSTIAELKMAPFTTVFSMSTIVYGINHLYFAKKPNNSRPIGGIRDALTMLSNFKVFGQISFLVVIAIIAIMGVWSLPSKTVFGKNIYIVGGDPETAKVFGINVGKVTIAISIIRPMFVGLAGILGVVGTGSANPAYGNACEFNAISSCVVGGISLSGGMGKAFGVIIGVLILTFISYGLAYTGANSNWQPIVEGLTIYSAAALDMRKSS